jgi:hypothetical protein
LQYVNPIRNATYLHLLLTSSKIYVQNKIMQFLSSYKSVRSGMAAGVLILFLWVLCLAVFPDLHEEIHHDAHEEEHSCAVTLILSGGTETPIISTDVVYEVHATVAPQIVDSVSIPSFFLSGYLREHSPPPAA